MKQRRNPKGTARSRTVAVTPRQQSLNTAAAQAAALAATQPTRETHRELSRASVSAAPPSAEAARHTQVETEDAESQECLASLDSYLQERYARNGEPSRRQRQLAEQHVAELNSKIAQRDGR